MNNRIASIFLVTFLSLASTACEGWDTDTHAPTPASDCPGATQAQADKDYDPRVLRGRVLAPHAELASTWTDVFVSSAHAAPLEDEEPVAGATVELYRIGPTGEQTGDILQIAETNTEGEWCIGLPEGIEPGNDLMLRATGTGATLRRLAISEITTDIYTGTEAMTRLIQDRKVDFHRIPRETFLNMESVADTAVDLLEPVALNEDDDVTSLIARLRETMADDERFSEKLSTLPTRSADK